MNIPSFEAVREFGKFLADSGYDLAHIGGDLDLGDLPHGNRRNRQMLRYKTGGGTALHVLARLFHAGEPVETEICRGVPSSDVVSTLVATGMVEERGGQLEPVCTLIPFCNRIIACDGLTAEWVQIKGQPWQARLKEWMDKIPCDVMAISTAQYSPL